MARKRHSAEEIIHKLREAEVALGQGMNVRAVCKQIAVTEQTYYCWRREYGGLRLDLLWKQPDDVALEERRRERCRVSRVALQEPPRGRPNGATQDRRESRLRATYTAALT